MGNSPFDETPADYFWPHKTRRAGHEDPFRQEILGHPYEPPGPKGFFDDAVESMRQRDRELEEILERLRRMEARLEQVAQSVLAADLRRDFEELTTQWRRQMAQRKSS